MKIEHYAYTRGAEMDYGLFSAPGNLTKSQIDIVGTKLMSILGDDVDRDLKTPKWILYKDYNLLVWGLCCENRLLALNPQETTHKNRPVRGFFAIVISDFTGEDLRLPFDINYFRELYLNEVEKYWSQKEQHQNQTIGYLFGKYNFVSAAHNNYIELLNTDIFQCQSLGELDREGVIAAALTLNNVSLLIDNDNIEQATNRNGSFMNCLTSSVNFGLHHVKQQCPKCKKYVSSFTQTGVCLDCKETEEVIIRRTRKDDDMDKQIKIELELAQNKIVELKSEVESNRLQLKKKDRVIKILAAALVVLLIALLYSQDSFSLKLFEKKQETQYTPGGDPCNRDNGRYDNDYMHYQEATFKFRESTINVDAGAHNEFPIKVQSSDDKYRIKSNVDWIKILSTKMDLITIEIAANEQKESRKGEVIVTYGDSDTSSVVITQNGK